MATENETVEGARAGGRYDRDTVALDLLALLLVPLALVLLHALGSPSLRTSLALDHADPEAAEFLTAAYVHATRAHLRNNVLGFLAAAPMAYMLCVRAGRRRWFYATTTALLLVVPVAVNYGNYATLRVWYAGPAPTSSGFSAVVAATGGFVFVALVVWLATLYSRSTATFAGALVALSLVATFYALHADAVEPSLVALIGVTAALCALALAVGSDVPIGVDASTARTVLPRAVPVVLVAVLLATFVVGLFPTSVVRDGIIVNVYAHGAGFVLGVVLAAGLEPLVDG